MRGELISIPVEGGRLGGWVTGNGPPVLLLHGGPGLTSEYLDDLADEIGAGYQVAAYQQRGLAPSMIDGPYDIDTHLADITAVLDQLGWQKAYLVGHSWGGHLVFHAAVTISDRLLGALAVDPLGAVGDGGMEKFQAEMVARCPDDVRAKVEALDAAQEAGEPVEDEMGGIRLYWPAYFAEWDAAPPLPFSGHSTAANTEGIESLKQRRESLEAALPSIRVPFGIVAGARSPMPAHEAAELSAAPILGGWVEVVADAGHLPWFEKPGCVRAALDRLARA